VERVFLNKEGYFRELRFLCGNYTGSGHWYIQLWEIHA